MSFPSAHPALGASLRTATAAGGAALRLDRVPGHRRPSLPATILRMMRRCLFLLALAPTLLAQVEIRVDAAATQGPFPPIFAWFGYDEPNYTYTANGQKLLGELAALSPVPVAIRTHHLLITGDGTAGHEMGLDQRLHRRRRRASRSTTGPSSTASSTLTCKPRAPVRRNRLHAGSALVPARALRPQLAQHARRPRLGAAAQRLRQMGRTGAPVGAARRGAIWKAEVETWQWELWNEPDIFYWRGTPEEYDKLYDYTADAITPRAAHRQSGRPGHHQSRVPRRPARTCGSSWSTARAASTRSPAKPARRSISSASTPRARRAWSMATCAWESPSNLVNVQKGFEIVNQFPQFRNLPIVLSESDPEGCAACPLAGHPESGLPQRHASIPAYTAVMLGNILKLADRYQSNIEGMLTWAFEFEDKQYFEGFRTLATNGIDKPILNLFRMAGLMRGDRVQLTSSGAVGLDAILQAGVTGAPDIDGLATRAEREMAVMVWNYHDDDLPAPSAPVRLAVSGLPAAAGRVLVEHFRIDEGPQQRVHRCGSRWDRRSNPQPSNTPGWKLRDNCSSWGRPSGCRSRTAIWSCRSSCRGKRSGQFVKSELVGVRWQGRNGAIMSTPTAESFERLKCPWCQSLN